MARNLKCIIWRMFVDAKNREYHINKYCKDNCQYKCLKGEPIKQIKL